jgi:hypothetical protein
LVADPDETAMPAATAQASAAWVRMSIDHAAEHGYNAVVEGTFRNPATTLGTAAHFAAAGHRVHIVALAVPEVVSRLSCLERYYSDHAAGRSGRWTPMAAHDAGYTGTPATVAAAEAHPAVHRITVVDRAGQILFDDTRDAHGRWQRTPGAAAALTARRELPLTPDERQQWLTTYAKVQVWTADVRISQEAQDTLALVAADAHQIGGATASVPEVPAQTQAAVDAAKKAALAFRPARGTPSSTSPKHTPGPVPRPLTRNVDPGRER